MTMIDLMRSQVTPNWTRTSLGRDSTSNPAQPCTVKSCWLVLPDNLNNDLFRELDYRHVVGHVPLTMISAGLIDIPALGRGGSARLGHEPVPDDIRVLRDNSGFLDIVTNQR